jgi:predicted  nucleic acid-binding Zn-ribbon protein
MKSSGSGFACMECGHRFKTVKAAEQASFGPSGCPGCGGSDIDLERSTEPKGSDASAVEESGR